MEGAAPWGGDGGGALLEHGRVVGGAGAGGGGGRPGRRALLEHGGDGGSARARARGGRRRCGWRWRSSWTSVWRGGSSAGGGGGPPGRRWRVGAAGDEAYVVVSSAGVRRILGKKGAARGRPTCKWRPENSVAHHGRDAPQKLTILWRMCWVVRHRNLRFCGASARWCATEFTRLHSLKTCAAVT